MKNIDLLAARRLYNIKNFEECAEFLYEHSSFSKGWNLIMLLCSCLLSGLSIWLSFNQNLFASFAAVASFAFVFAAVASFAFASFVFAAVASFAFAGVAFAAVASFAFAAVAFAAVAFAAVAFAAVAFAAVAFAAVASDYLLQFSCYVIIRHEIINAHINKVKL